jgi:hypothetical protein
VKQPQEIVGNTLEHTGIGSDFLNNTKGSASKKKNGQMGLHQTKKLLLSK